MDVTREDAQKWVSSIHETIRERAQREEVPIREFACTLLAGLVGRQDSAFLQIGDGAMVIDVGLSWRTVFWPQKGEFFNATAFLTDERPFERMEFESRGVVRDLAVFTDGLETIMLDFQSRQVCHPLVKAMFDSLVSASRTEISTLGGMLSRFLTSERVNARTDDDKTLILATRRPGDVF